MLSNRHCGVAGRCSGGSVSRRLFRELQRLALHRSATTPARLALVCLLLAFVGVVSAVADDPITNPVSQVVSYQYPEDFTSAALTNGGVMSPVVSYQYYEWPGDENVPLHTSPLVSYYYQSGSGSQAIVVSGRVTGTGGIGLSGAQVTASVQLAIVAQTSTDSNGYYSLPALLPGTYALKVTRASYASAARAFTLSASSATQNFQLIALPAAPGTQTTTRQVPTAFTQPPVGPMGATLKVFDGTQFVPITSQNTPSHDLMTIVLMHGWTSDPDAWPKDMAAQLRANGVTSSQANIVAWDWQVAAVGLVGIPGSAEERTPLTGCCIGDGSADGARRGLSSSYTFHGPQFGHAGECRCCKLPAW